MGLLSQCILYATLKLSLRIGVICVWNEYKYVCMLLACINQINQIMEIGVCTSVLVFWECAHCKKTCH